MTNFQFDFYSQAIKKKLVSEKKAAQPFAQAELANELQWTDILVAAAAPYFKYITAGKA